MPPSQIRTFKFLIPSVFFLATLPLMQGCGGRAQPLPPEETIARAREHTLQFNFSLSKNVLDQQERHFPEDHELYPKFLYLQALSNWHAVPPVPDDVRRSAVQFAELADRFPDHELAPSALLYMGRVHDIRDFMGDEPDFESARAAYRRILDDYPDHLLAGDAAIRYGMTFIKQVKDPEQMAHGVAFIADWLEEHPDSLHRPLILLFLANMYDQFLHDRPKAFEYYLPAAETGFVNPGRAGNNNWRLLELAVEVGLTSVDVDPGNEGWFGWDLAQVPEEYLRVAIETAQRIITDYPRSGRGFESVQVLNRIREAQPDVDFEIPELRLFDLDDEETSQ